MFAICFASQAHKKRENYKINEERRMAEEKPTALPIYILLSDAIIIRTVDWMIHCGVAITEMLFILHLIAHYIKLSLQ